LGQKTLESLEIGFGGETIHPSWSLRGDHPGILNVLHCEGVHFIATNISLLVAKMFPFMLGYLVWQWSLIVCGSNTFGRGKV
jgi:hypothetical protein